MKWTSKDTCHCKSNKNHQKHLRSITQRSIQVKFVDSMVSYFKYVIELHISKIFIIIYTDINLKGWYKKSMSILLLISQQMTAEAADAVHVTTGNPTMTNLKYIFQIHSLLLLAWVKYWNESSFSPKFKRNSKKNKWML